jgi:hypothetical protein
MFSTGFDDMSETGPIERRAYGTATHVQGKVYCSQIRNPHAGTDDEVLSHGSQPRFDGSWVPQV